MPEVPLIHIGYPKTASTWFRENLFSKSSNYDLMTREDVANVFISPYGNCFDADKATEFIKKIYSKNLIVSDERLLGGMYSGGYNGFASAIIARRLQQVFPEAKILIFIRNQTDIIASTYYHYIMYGGTYGINKFLFPQDYYIIQKLGLFSFEFFNYYNTIEFYKSLFRKVSIYLYEDFNANRNYFVSNFVEENNIAIDLNKIDYSKNNARYRTSLIYLKRFVSLFTRKQLAYKYYICNIPYLFNVSLKIFNILNHYRFFGKPVKSEKLLKKNNISFIKDYYKQQNNLLIKDFKLNRISKYNYPL